MHSLKSFAQTCVIALFAIAPAGFVQADLSASDIQAIDGKSGLRVFSADGSFLGLTNGITANPDRTRLFVVPRSGSLFRFRGKDIVITANTSLVSLRGSDLIVEATDQRLRRTAKTSNSSSFDPVRIYLLHP